MTVRKAPACVICDRHIVMTRLDLCGECSEAYDRWNRRSDGDTLGLIVWAARRSRRFTKKSVRNVVLREAIRRLQWQGSGTAVRELEAMLREE